MKRATFRDAQALRRARAERRAKKQDEATVQIKDTTMSVVCDAVDEAVSLGLPGLDVFEVPGRVRASLPYAQDQAAMTAALRAVARGHLRVVENADGSLTLVRA